MALVEFAIIAMPLAMVVFTAVDLGSRAEYHNRLRSAAREGALLAEIAPGRITGCPAGVEDIGDRILSHDPSLAELTNFGFSVKAYPSEEPLPALCDLDAPPVPPGGKVLVEVHADHKPGSPLSKWVLEPEVVARAIVVVQG